MTDIVAIMTDIVKMDATWLPTYRTPDAVVDTAVAQAYLLGRAAIHALRVDGTYMKSITALAPQFDAQGKAY